MIQLNSVSKDLNIALRTPRRLGGTSVALLAVFLLGAAICAHAATETDASGSFGAGSTGYQANVPPTSANLLFGITPVETGDTKADRNTANTTVSQNVATLTDGSFGLVPASGGGGSAEVAIASGSTLTYTLSSTFNLTRVDVFTSWGDNGRFQPSFTFSYATVAAPNTFIPIAPTVNYAPGGNATWVNLTALGIDTVPVKFVRFTFNNQQNGYVGYTELAVQGTPTPTVTSVAPNAGVPGGGTVVSVIGTNFTAGATISFGGVNAASQTFVDAQHYNATTPPGTGGTSVNVTYTNGNNVFTLTNGYTFSTNPVASVSSVTLDPTGTATGPSAGGTVILINGTNFRNTTAPIVTIGGSNGFAPVSAANVQFLSSTQLRATTPAASPVATVGATRVTVTNTDDSLGGFLEGGFTYATPVLTWTGATDSNWGTASNWDLNRIPVNLDAVVLTGAGVNPTNMNIPNLTLVALTFDQTATTAFIVNDTSVGTTGLTLLNGPVTLNVSAADQTLNLKLNLSNSVSFVLGTGRTLSLNDVVSGSGGAALSGGGKVILNANNTFSTATVGNGTTLQIGNGTLNGSATGNIINNNTVLFNNPGAASLSGNISGGGSVVMAGTGTATLSGTNSYTGNTTVSSGTLKGGSATAFNNTSVLNLSANAIFDLGGFNASFKNVLTSATTNTITNNGAANARFTISDQTNTLAALLIDGTKTLGINLANNLSASPLITLTNANTFSGGLTLLHNAVGGTRLRISTAYTTNGVAGAIVSGPFGKGPITIGTAATDRAQILLDLASNISIPNDFVFNTTLGSDIGGAIRADTTGHVLSGTLTAVNANASFLSGGGTGGAFSLTGKITGAMGLQLLNSAVSNTVTVNNATASPNDYQGNTTIGNLGTLSIGAANQIPDGAGTGDVAILGTLKLNGFNETVNGLTGSGTVDGTSGTPTFTAGANNATSKFNGIIKNTAGVLNFVKTGTGTLTLNNASTYSGTTNITAGTVKLFDSTGISYIKITGDGDSGLSASNLYTHAVNPGGGITINSIPFTFAPAGNITTALGTRTYTRTGVGTVTIGNSIATDGTNKFGDATFPFANGAYPNVTGSIASFFGYFGYNGDPRVVTLTNLLPNTVYDVRFYQREFGLDIGRNFSVAYDVGATGTPQFTSPVVDEDHPEATPALAALNIAQNNAWAQSYTYQTGPGQTSIKMTVSNPNSADSYHFYGFSNQLAPATTTNALPSGTTVTINTNATLEVASGTQQIAVLADAAGTPTGHKVVLTGGTLDVGATNANSSFSGVISGTGNLLKTGTGKLTLTANNTFTGATSSVTGTLVLNGTLTPTSTFSVNANGVLRGTSTNVQRDVQLIGNGTIWPGTSDFASSVSASEVLTVNGNLGTGTLSKIKIALNNTATQKLLLPTLSLPLQLNTTTLSLGIATGTNKQYVVIDASNGAANPITQGLAGFTVNTPATNPAGVTVDYLNDANAVVTPSDLTPANRVRVTVSGAVTPVTIAAFDAKSEGAGVLVSWNSISEFQNAGFNIYRRSLESSEWTRVNPALITGRITSPDLKVYSLYDWTVAGMYEYKLESIAIDGTIETHPALSGMVKVDGAVAVSSMGFDAAIGGAMAEVDAIRAQESSAKFAQVPIGQRAASQTNARTVVARNADGSLVKPAMKVNVLDRSSGATVATAEATPRSAAPASAPTSMIAARWFTAAPVSTSASFSSAKVTYGASGVLLIPQASLPAGFNIKHLSVQREGRALVPLALTADGLVVFGQGYEDDYTNKDALFLRATSGATNAGQIAHATGLFDANQTVNTNTPASVTNEFHDVYFDYNYGFRPFVFEPWFSSKYLTSGSTQDFDVSTPFASSGASALTVNVWSLTQSDTVTEDHALQVLVNGQAVGQAVWSGGGKMLQLTFQIPSGGLNAGNNTIELVTPAIDGVDSQIAFVHSVTVAYTRELDGSKPVTITNTDGSSHIYEVGNVTTTNAWVVDTRFPDRAALVPFESQVQANGTFKVRFTAASGGSGQYMVVPFGQENAPVSVTKSQIKPVTTSAGTYWAVGPTQFSAGVQPLLTAHNREGIRGSFINQEQLFDYYNYGRYGPAGIQKAVRAVRPQYLLLLGRTTYDYKNYSGANVDPMCPTFLVATSFWAQTTSDSMFGDLGRGYPEVAVGRLPVNNTTELSGAVKHVLGYTGAPVSGVRVNATTDAADATVADFPAQAATLSQTFPDLTWQPNYFGVTYQDAGEVTNAMTTAANGGADWIVYIGHGNASHLGKYVSLLDTNTVQAWTGNVVLMQSTCTANWQAVDAQGYKSIAIQALTQPQGGISASIASSTYMNSDCAVEFMTQLMKNAESGNSVRWGTALMKTQQWAFQKGSGFYADLNKTEQIFGDPAMSVFMKGSTTTNPGSGSNAPTTPPVTGTF